MVQVTYERCQEMPAGVPLIIDEDADGAITVCISSQLITEAACVLLTRTAGQLCANRVLVPALQQAG